MPPAPAGEVRDNDDREHQIMEREDGRFQNEAAAAAAAAAMSTDFDERLHPSTLGQPPRDWRSSARQSQPAHHQSTLDLGFIERGGGGFRLPPHQASRSTLQTSLPPSLQGEMTTMQRQRLSILHGEQARLQRMNEAMNFTQQRPFSVTSSSKTPVESQFGRAEALARQRLKKRRLPEASPMPRLSRRGNSFPMPRMEDDDGHEIRLGTMKIYQQKWDELALLAKLRFPLDNNKQRDYTKHRFSSALEGGFVPTPSFQSMRDFGDDDDGHGQSKKRRAIREV